MSDQAPPQRKLPGLSSLVSYKMPDAVQQDFSDPPPLPDMSAPIYSYESFDCDAAYRELGNHDLRDLESAHAIVENCASPGGGGIAAIVRKQVPRTFRLLKGGGRGSGERASPPAERPRLVQSGPLSHDGMDHISAFVNNHRQSMDRNLLKAIDKPKRSRIVQRIDEWFMVGRMKKGKLTVTVYSKDGSREVAHSEIDLKHVKNRLVIDPWEKYNPELDDLVRHYANYWKKLTENGLMGD